MRMHEKFETARCNKDQQFVWILSRFCKQYVKKHLRLLLFGVASMVVSAMTTAFSAHLIRPIIDEIFIAKNIRLLYFIPFLFALNAVINSIALYYEKYNVKSLGQKIVISLQLHLYRSLIYADINFMNMHPSGNFISRFANDINIIRNHLSYIITGAIKGVFTLIALFASMIYLDAYLSFIIITSLVVVLWPVIKFSTKIQMVSQQMQKEFEKLTVQLDNNFRNSHLIQSYCREEHEIKKAETLLEKVLSMYHKSLFIQSLVAPISVAVISMSITGIILYGGFRIMESDMSIGTLSAFITTLMFAYKPLKDVLEVNNLLQEFVAILKRIFVILDQDRKIKVLSKSPITSIGNTSISLNNLSFKYSSSTPFNRSIDVLSDINMKVEHGQTAAIVGRSGHGKSTILNLIQRLYDPDDGSITIGGDDIRNIDLQTLRKSISFVSQNIHLFNTTILDNIRYGRPDASEEEVIDAALAADAHDFIMNLPDGYSTVVRNDGVQLSGGEKQKICIARAIIKKAPILLLDEASSSLDIGSEKHIQMALEYIKKDRTTIIVAHKLSSIQHADVIYVLSDGMVVESGNHHDLIVSRGIYYDMHKKMRTA